MLGREVSPGSGPWRPDRWPSSAVHADDHALCVPRNPGCLEIFYFFCLFFDFFGPPRAGDGPKMWPRGPAFEPQSIFQIRPMAARLVAKIRFERIAGAKYFLRQLSKPEGRNYLGAFPAPYCYFASLLGDLRREASGGRGRVGVVLHKLFQKPKMATKRVPNAGSSLGP